MLQSCCWWFHLPTSAGLQSEDTDFEAAVEVSQTLRRNMQREARLSYKFEVRRSSCGCLTWCLRSDVAACTTSCHCTGALHAYTRLQACFTATRFSEEGVWLLCLQKWFGTELLTPLQFARVAAGSWPVVVADGLRIGTALLAERGTPLVQNN